MSRLYVGHLAFKVCILYLCLTTKQRLKILFNYKTAMVANQQTIVQLLSLQGCQFKTNRYTAGGVCRKNNLVILNV